MKGYLKNKDKQTNKQIPGTPLDMLFEGFMQKLKLI